MNKMQKAAKELLKVFPSCHDLMNHEITYKILNPFHIAAFSNSQEWEGLAMAVNEMCLRAQDRPFYKNYCFYDNKEEGRVEVFPANGESITINHLSVFKALLIIMFCSWLQLEVFARDKKEYEKKSKDIREKQSQARLNFISSDCTIYQILD